ncbi:TPA: AAA family ATPase [Vibrio parahaemolyticus]|uniref:AAA family ATPase n=1 Tax=Vibrio sp. Isolate24 TaxID=2908534 RepID=UPI001EFD2260|nr:AAA family ATPase [Vibrio sp. Isolate24]MCG9680484.1 AAA family ATPase [Vibrio sp. Isolate24]HCH2844794.1 AAA family ATPase [Vibrio parahaemolyticus]
MEKLTKIFKPKKMAQIVEAMTEREPLVAGLWDKGETMMVFAGSGVGKSLFSYNLVETLATEQGEFLGQDCATNQKVLYLDGEMSTNSIGSRVDPDMLDDIGSIDYIASEVNEEVIDLTNDEQRAFLIEMARGYDVVVLDSVRVLFGLTDENNAESWRSVNSLVVALRSLGCSVLVIHHANKSDSEVPVYSGSTNAITVFDRTLAVSGTEYKQLHGQKSRNAAWGEWLDECVFFAGEFGKLSLMTQAQRDQSKMEEIVDMLSLDRRCCPTGKREKRMKVNKILDAGLGNSLTNQKLWNAAEYLFDGFWTKDDFDSAIAGDWGELESPIKEAA